MSWIGGALSLAGGLIGSGAASDAASAQSAATQAGIAEQQREFDQIQANEKPFQQAGVSSLQQLMTLMGLSTPAGAPGNQTLDQIKAGLASQYTKPSPSVWQSDGTDSGGGFMVPGAPVVDQNALNAAAQAKFNAQPKTNPSADPNFGSLTKPFSISDFWNDPVVQASYQSGLDLGTKALKNMAPLTTGLDSGAALKELTQFGTNYTGNMAAGSQQRYVNDQSNLYNKFANIAGLGQTATQATDNAGLTTAGNIANMTTAQGNANAASKIAGANAWTGGLSSISTFLNQQNLLNQLRGTTTGTNFPVINDATDGNTFNDWE